MKRKIYNQLLKWKNESNGECALLIEGARRIGKSYIVEEFAKNEYDTYLLIDFNKVHPMVHEWFDIYLENLDLLFLHLSNHYNVRLIRRKSLIIFDEVQMCPRARAAIKYLVADGRYDYIETGSLISIKKNVKDIVIPSEEMHLQMYPMDFEEFLWANGNDMLMDFIHEMFDKKKPMGQVLHRKAMDLFRLYLIIGGMPQAVNKYIETKDFTKVDNVKRNILSIYRDDISKYATNVEVKVTSIFDEIPSQLQKHEKKFRISALGNGSRMRDYDDAFFWLDDAKIINTCYNTTEPNIGLRLNMERTTLKCYMADTGLLISHSFDERNITSEAIYNKILHDKLEFNEGMIAENIVAQMLKASGHKLYFYSNSSSKEAENRMEIDFLIAKSSITNKHNICPIEVKSGKRYTTVSLDKFINKYSNSLATAYIIHDGDYYEKDGITYLPFYMTPFL